MDTIAARPGLVVMDTSLNLVACNLEAIQALTFPDNPESICNLNRWLRNRIRSSLLKRDSFSSSKFVDEFKSAKRVYSCRTFAVTTASVAHRPSHPALILMLERKPADPIGLADISRRFNLTLREQQTVQLLLEGLTSKDIAARLNISPNTVNTYIRLMMVKMRVSSRAGIIGKIVAPKA